MLTAVGGAAAAVLVAIVLLIPFSSTHLRGRVTAALADRLDADVSLGSFRASIFPSLRVDGANLVIRQRSRGGSPPVISIKSFSAEGGLLPLLRRHVTTLRLVGLDIEIPPDRDAKPRDADTHDAVATTGTVRRSPSRSVVIDHLVSSDARLAILPSDPEDRPKVWAIHQLEMERVGLDTEMPFRATLTNAVPPGEIKTSGKFGPWQTDEPGRTPLQGSFVFANADLGVFKGISGTLSARGGFGGSLGRIDITGETDTPQFAIAVARHPVPLHATYHSIVDGTNGDTILERIDARIIDTTIIARGAVTDTPGVDGRTVTVEAAIDGGRLEDVLLLAVPTPKPPMTGGLDLTTKIVIPPGDVDVVEKLQLDGRFGIKAGRFTSYDIQKKINELSRRSRGQTAPDGTRAASNFSGRFTLAHALLKLPDLRFAVPGAEVRLAGGYGLRSERLDFTGTLLMDASVSETQQGFKRVLLKIVDPLFRKDGGGSAIPIKVTGTRNDPSFGLDKGRIFSRK